MKQIVSNYSYSPTTNVVTLTGVNIDADQLLLIVAPQVGRTMYNFASVTGTVSAGADTRVTLNASTVGLTTTSPLVIFYDDQAATQTIAGTVTVGMLAAENSANSFPNQTPPIQLKANSQDGALRVRMDYVDGAIFNTNVVGYKSSEINAFSAVTYAFIKTHVNNSVTIGSLPVISGTVTVSSLPASTVTVSSLPVISGTVTVGNTVTIAGTVTANPTGTQTIAGTVTVGYITDARFVGYDSGDAPERAVAIGFYKDALDNFVQVGKLLGYGLPVEFNNSVTIGSLPAISGTVTVGNSVTIGSLPTITPQLPRVTFIDGSGTVTTANTAVTVFASSSTRSYLLVQVTTGSAFVNVGATATTVNGISLTAGQGYAWETTIPQGLVSLISTTTNSAYVAKQA